MATAAEIAAFRLTIAETAPESLYTDEMLSDRLDKATNTNSLAYSIWTEKAAKYSTLVDVQEGSSSRKLSQLQDQALKMVAVFKSLTEDAGGGASTGRTTTRQIERV